MACEVLGDDHEICEGISLLHQAPGIVPRLAHVAAAADMSEGHHDAPVEQAETVTIETDRQ